MDEWFKAYNSWGDVLDAMSDEDAGILAKAIWECFRTGSIPDVSGPAKYAIIPIASAIFEGKEKRNAFVKKQSDNAKKRWEEKSCQTIPNYAKLCQTMPDYAKLSQTMPILGNNNNTMVSQQSNNNSTVTPVTIVTPTKDTVTHTLNTTKRFIPPTLQEVREYVEQGHYPIDPEEFIDRNNAVGWVDKNGNKYKDWKAVVRTWARYRKEDRSGADYGSHQRDHPPGVLIPGATPIKHGKII